MGKTSSSNSVREPGKASRGSYFSSVRGKFLFTGALGVAAALIIGIVGIYSVNRNSRNSEVASLVNNISVKQTQNLANDAQYQHYVNQSYIQATLDNLKSMNEDASKLKAISDASYGASIDSIIANVSRDSSNYQEMLSIHNERGYDESIGVYKEFMDASAELSGSLQIWSIIMTGLRLSGWMYEWAQTVRM